jgi:AcrR family transcriptional regulator
MASPSTSIVRARPRRSSDDRRRDLVEAAVRVMSRDGVAAATTRAITAEAGMAQSRFHYCFRSKAELLREVVETMVRTQVVTVLDAVRADAGGNVRDRLHAALQAYCQHLADNPERHQLSYELTQYALRTPELAELPAQQYQAYLDGAAEVLESVTDWPVPMDTVARMVIALLDGVTLQWLVNRDRATAAAVLEAFADQLAATLLARPVVKKSAAKIPAVKAVRAG